jgi:hypothetical protein
LRKQGFSGIIVHKYRKVLEYVQSPFLSGGKNAKRTYETDYKGIPDQASE